MGILLTTRQTLNLLLPFTHPDTPLAQDLAHTAILITTLYFAPHIAEHYTTHYRPAPPTDNAARQRDSQHHPPDDAVPVDETFVLQEQDEERDTDPEVQSGLAAPPPHAPTPPPGDQIHIPPQDGPAWRGGEPGPAHERPPPTRAPRVVGAKKAKSLARRDQRRAYHEFHRSQAEQRREAEEAGRVEREAALAAEKARRAEVEREISEEKREERARRREEERREAEEEVRRRERAVERVRDELGRTGAVDLVRVAVGEGKDRVWVERLVRASGLIAYVEKEREGIKVMITGEAWLVSVDAELVKTAYAEAAEFADARGGGKISFADFDGILEKAVRVRAASVA